MMRGRRRQLFYTTSTQRAAAAWLQNYKCLRVRIARIKASGLQHGSSHVTGQSFAATGRLHTPSARPFRHESAQQHSITMHMHCSIQERCKSLRDVHVCLGPMRPICLATSETASTLASAHIFAARCKREFESTQRANCMLCARVHACVRTYKHV